MKHPTSGSKRTKTPRGPRNALAAHRARLKQRGVARVEVQVSTDDVALIRAVANALSDPTRAAQTRAALRKQLGGPPAAGLKELLASAPLAGIDLRRSRDAGRPVDL